MKSVTNIFSALNLLEDNDEDFVTDEASSKAKMTAGKSKRASPSRSAEDGSDKEGLQKPLVWIDLEMTGLDQDKDRILEIACIISDGKLEQLIEGPDLIIHQSEGVLAQMNDWCQEHHTASGLVEAVLRSTVSQEEAEQQVLAFVSQHVPSGRALLAGNSVYVDRMFLQKYMPKLADYFSHVLVDVSNLRALCVRWYPREARRAPRKKKMHRALDDVKESIVELRYMQRTIFKQPKL